MNTATKVIGGIGIVTLIALGMRKKKTTTTTVATTQQPVKSTTDYEGKLVVMDNGHWFVVKDGKRWFTSTAKAISDFQTAYPGNENAIQNVPAADLEKYPISGSIEEGLQFVPFGATKLGNAFIPTTFRGV